MPRDTLAELSDDQPLVLDANGDPDAARLLMQRLLSRVFGFARRMLSDAAEAEDAAQETMLRLWRVAPQWRAGEAQVSTWTYRVVSNLCTDRLRLRTLARPFKRKREVGTAAACRTSVVGRLYRCDDRCGPVGFRGPVARAYGTWCRTGTRGR